jgi:hypothetical protein
MKKTLDGTIAKTSRTYRLLRPVFAAGLALSLVLYFVPCYEPSGAILNAWTTRGEVARPLSSFDLCLLLVRTGNVQWGAFYIASSGAELVLLLLALLRPRRWVFVAGSCEQLYFLAAFLLRSRADDLAQPLFWALLAYATWAMTLTGFFIKPPRPVLAGRLVGASQEMHEQRST